MPYFFSPIGNDQQVDNNGKPLVGGKILTYEAGTSTPATTYTSNTGFTPHSNPIVLNALGLPASPIWLEGGKSYKFVITDSANVVQRTVDNVVGVNDRQETLTQWVPSGMTPTYITANSFSVPGDQTAILQPNRRLEWTLNSGTFYGYIFSSVFGSGVTTVTVVPDSTGLDVTFSSFRYGFISATNTSIPQQFIIAAGDKFPSKSALNIGDSVSTDGTVGVWVRPFTAVNRGSNTQLVRADNNTRIRFTGAFTQTIAAGSTLGPGWTVQVTGYDSGLVVLDADGAETFLTRVGAKTTINVYPGETFRIVWNGAAFEVLGRAQTVTLQERILAAVSNIQLKDGWLDPEFKAIRFEWTDLVTSVANAGIGIKVFKGGGVINTSTYAQGLQQINTGGTTAAGGGTGLAQINPVASATHGRSQGVVVFPFPTSANPNFGGTIDVTPGRLVTSPMRILGGFFEGTAGAVEGIDINDPASLATYSGVMRTVGERF